MNRRIWTCFGTAFLALMVVASFTLTGCGKDNSGGPSKPGTPNASTGGGGGEGGAPAGGDGKAGTASISGKITFKGTPPPNGNIDMNAHPDCAKQHPDGMKEQVYCVGDGGSLQWVLVSVSKGDEVVGKKWPTPTAPVTLDQHGCRYEPHVWGMMVNQPISIKNSDPTMHNIDAMPNKAKPFNDSQGASTPPLTRTFDAAESWIAVKCDVHSWMHCFVGVFTHPYFAVSDEKGAYTIANLPAGKYTLRAQHEKAGKVEKEIEVKDGEKGTCDFEFPGK